MTRRRERVTDPLARFFAAKRGPRRGSTPFQLVASGSSNLTRLGLLARKSQKPRSIAKRQDSSRHLPDTLQLLQRLGSTDRKVHRERSDGLDGGINTGVAMTNREPPPTFSETPACECVGVLLESARIYHFNGIIRGKRRFCSTNELPKCFVF
jgi:hypothetical protein